MKKHLNELYFVLLNREKLSALAEAADENLATCHNGKVFSQADLWNIQRGKRQHSARKLLA